jgi:DNA-binding NarL/FixJ family response regulator
VREGLSLLLSREPDLEVVGEAADADEALRHIENLSPTLVVVDISLKRGSGLSLLKDIHAKFPGVKTLVSSMHDESLYGERSLRAGATGYINKQEATATIVEAIRAVLRGKTYVSAALRERMQAGGSGKDDVSPLESLSDREHEVLLLIGHGLSTQLISQRLDLSVHTIETYREKIKGKLNLKNAAELWRFAVQTVLEQGWALPQVDDKVLSGSSAN